MRDDFDQCNERGSQLGNLSVKAWFLRAPRLWGLGALALSAAVVWVIAARWLTSPAPAPMVMGSGRDDHGLGALKFVPLVRAPDDNTPLAAVADGSFARIIEQRGEWMRVQLIASPQIAGWVNDYYLRNRALRTDGRGQVEFVDAQMVNDRLLIAVRPVTSPTAQPVWVDASGLREIGAR